MHILTFYNKKRNLKKFAGIFLKFIVNKVLAINPGAGTICRIQDIKNKISIYFYRSIFLSFYISIFLHDIFIIFIHTFFYKLKLGYIQII